MVRRRGTDGFTLIELMLVVAIIGILAALAVPQYQNYVIKSDLVEAVTDLGASKLALNESYSANGNAFPISSPIATANLNAKYVKAITYNRASATTASVVATLGGTGNPTVDAPAYLGIFGAGHPDGSVAWVCGTAGTAASTAPAGKAALYPYLPASCQQ